LICEDCAQIKNKTVNLVPFFADVDPDVNVDAICFVSHQFGLLCANLHSNAEEVVAR